MYKDLENKILGNRLNKLTLIETAELFRENLTSEFIIRKALQEKAIDPDFTILQIVPRLNNKDYLIPFALCLRYGANPNLYVNDSKMGNIHILGYIYTLYPIEFRKTVIFNTIIMILIASSSDPNMKFFGAPLASGQSTTVSSQSTGGRTVIQWLNDNRYVNILDSIQNVTALKNNTDDKSLVELSLILNNINLKPANYQYNSKNYTLAIRSFCDNNIINSIPLDDTMVMLDYKMLYDCLNYVNVDVFNYLLNTPKSTDKSVSDAIVPSYVFINEILIRMKETFNNDILLIFNELKNFIIAAVNIGIQFDQEQYIIINSLNFSREFNEVYQIPLWKKLCSTGAFGAGTTGVSRTIKRLAISLNLDPSSGGKMICENLTKMSRYDPEVLKEANRRRQQMRINSELGYLFEFTNKKTPELIVKNQNKLAFNYLDYNDLDILFYRDQYDNVIAITSELFDSALETGINPLALNDTQYNNRISDINLLKIKQKKDLLRLLNIEPDPLGIYSVNIPVSFAESIDSLTKKDSISEKNALELVNKFIILANYNGVTSQQVRNYTKKDMMKKLKNIGFDINLEPLSTSHALVTTAYIVLNIDVKVAKTFF